MKPTPCMQALALAAACFASAAQAAPVTYYFEDTFGRSGEFTFDDVTAGLQFSAPGTATYGAINFKVEGSVLNPVAMGVNDDMPSGDMWVIQDNSGAGNVMGLVDGTGTAFNGTGLGQLGHYTLADFAGNGTGPSYLYFSGLLGYLTYFSTTAPAAPVPEPSAWAMLALGGLGLGALRGRRQPLA